MTTISTHPEFQTTENANQNKINRTTNDSCKYNKSIDYFESFNSCDTHSHAKKKKRHPIKWHVPSFVFNENIKKTGLGNQSKMSKFIAFKKFIKYAFCFQTQEKANWFQRQPCQFN